MSLLLSQKKADAQYTLKNKSVIVKPVRQEDERILNQLCFSEVSQAIVDIGINEVITLIAKDYDYTKPIILGENNTYTGKTYV